MDAENIAIWEMISDCLQTSFEALAVGESEVLTACEARYCLGNVAVQAIGEAQSSPALAAQLIEREMTDDTEPGVEKIMEHTHAEYWDNTLRAAEGRYLGGLLLYLSW
jgi:hypothetical protein